MCLKRRIRLSAALLALSLSPVCAHAQAVYGSIYGVVEDATGAVVPNATVTVTDSAKGISVNEQTNASGEYTVDHLIPDPYNVKVVANGFKAFETTDIRVFADTSTKIDASMIIGSEAQVVTVRSDSVPQLKTDRADVSTEFGAKQIVDLPIADRNFTNLQLLLPGAQQLGWSHAASEDPQGSKQIQVDGQAFGGVAYELDGTDNQDPILGIIVINPNADSLSETKITTQNFDAEFGKAVSSVVTAQTKSGSNGFHGSAFDYRESGANLAREPFTQGPSQLASSPFPVALKNQFGGALGGPILKDRAFFFVDYQGVRQKVGYANLQTVPSANLIQTCLGQKQAAGGIAGCDFSEYAASLPQGAGIIYQANGTPYPNNVIPAAQISPQAKNLFTLLQPYAPNSFGGKYPGLINNFAGSGTGLFNSDQWDVRVDAQATSNTHAFARFSRFTDILTGKTMFGAAGGAGFGLGGFGGNSSGANDSLAAGVDIAISPKLATDVRIGYYRYNIANTKYDQNVEFANQLGIAGLNDGTFFTGGSPSFQLTEVGSSGGPANSQATGPQYGAGLNVDRCNCPLTQREDQFQIVNNWTKTIGNHEVKFGGDIRYARNLRVPSDNDRTGILQFGTGPTSNPNITAANQSQGGLGFATFVLGDVTNFNRFVSTSTNAKEFQKRDFFYVQDTWHASPRLTVNYGLRYEFYFPESINQKGAGAVLNLDTGYLQVAGYGNLGSNMGFSQASNAYNPRIGIAYQPTDKTVIRAGYGRSFDTGVFGSIFGHTATQNLPILANQQITATGGQLSSAFNLATGPSAPTPIAIPANGLLPNPGSQVTSKARPLTMRLPTLDAWNLSIQQSITPTLAVTFAYVANKGTHTLSAGDGNSTNPNEAAIFLPAQYSVTGQGLHYDPNGGTCYPAGPTCTATGMNGGATVGKLIGADGAVQNQTLLQRYYGGSLPSCGGPCGWTDGIQYDGNNQDTHFNALQVTVAKQFTKGYSINGNYAWQRGFNFNSGFSTWSRQAVKGRDDSIREQQLIVYGLFELPFGHGKVFMAHASTWVNEIVGGWQFSPVLTYSSGLPFTLSYSSCSTSVPGDAPCYVNGLPKTLKTGVKGYPGLTGVTFYDQQTLGRQFTATALDQIGNSGRNSVYGPHFFNGDLSLQKNFAIKESLVAQFRIDAFNGFNHINLGNPSGNIENSGAITQGAGVNGSSNPRQLQLSARFQF